MNLCDLCSSINLEDLPPFPDDDFSKSLSGYPRFHHLVKSDFEKGARVERFGVQYHRDLDGLLRAAAEGCVLCEAVEKEAAALAEEIENLPRPRWGIARCDPSWDMWLVRRSEAGGDGLWVVCSSVVDGEGFPCLIPVAAVGFASDEDDPLSAGSSDRVLRQVPDQTTLNRIAAWLETCDEHPHCQSHGSPIPTRLLDLGTSDSDPLIKLVEPDASLCDRYVTLSYRWGEGNRHFITTSETMQARRTGIEVDALPQTMRDAVALTRMLGVRYLWIDSLCICQDDLGEWERESARMAAVYSNAYLTLAATKAADVNGGLLSSRTPRSYFKIPRRDGDGTYILASVLPLDKEVIHDYHTRMRDEPLTKRAWGFQERVLARRVLHFASGQMYWECLEGGFQAEEGLRLPRSLQCVSEDADVTAYARERAADNDTGSRRRRRWAKDEAGADLRSWERMLREYGPREMTDPADKLPAISGIANVMSKILDDEYVAGLWRGHLIRGLCWQGLSCRAVVEGYRAPSWSWASVDGVPATGHIGTLEEVAAVLDVAVEIAGENPFGRVRDGVIKLDAPLVRMRVSENKGPTGHVAFRSEKGSEDFYGMLDVMDRNYETSAEMLEEMGVYALVLAFTYASPSRGEAQEEEEQQSVPAARGLFVTPALDRPGCMRRIGAVVQKADAFAPGELESCRTTVSIV
ncbi:Heterokaryon incompatibility protein [Colletotrichum higginsianum IMI 349063]|uniref:Heterokaryon incompatibility protein n=1 Tax=Colletotrichum higginsianum (strain IMI 349063) TaxID=759273 RepID=A0A1B7XYA8_COLHI|nr:Heterokaryon incompatibility protein [Colletotrichum higginsianum IMI 349063]OBR04758.1 Heterokaryon incompatibility protein [Colletotrichum higginsianum IMI 349063]